MSHIEKTIDSTRIFEGKVVRLRRDTVELENGKQTFREVIDHPGRGQYSGNGRGRENIFRAAVPLSFGRMLLELPAGKLEPGKIRQTADAVSCGKKPDAPPDGLCRWAS